MIGRVATWEGRFGFIRTEHGERVFCHVDAVTDRRPLSIGTLVSFTALGSARGPRATAVERIEPRCAKCDRALVDLACACGWTLAAHVTSWPPPLTARKGYVTS